MHGHAGRVGRQAADGKAGRPLPLSCSLAAARMRCSCCCCCCCCCCGAVVGTALLGRPFVPASPWAPRCLQPNWSKAVLLLLAERVTRGDPRFAWCYSTPVAEASRVYPVSAAGPRACTCLLAAHACGSWPGCLHVRKHACGSTAVWRPARRWPHEVPPLPTPSRLCAPHGALPQVQLFEETEDEPAVPSALPSPLRRHLRAHIAMTLLSCRPPLPPPSPPPQSEEQLFEATEAERAGLSLLQRAHRAAASLLRLAVLLVLFSPVVLSAALVGDYLGISRKRWLRLLRRTLEVAGPAFIKARVPVSRLESAEHLRMLAVGMRSLAEGTPRAEGRGSPTWQGRAGRHAAVLQRACTEARAPPTPLAGSARCASAQKASPLPPRVCSGASGQPPATTSSPQTSATNWSCCTPRQASHTVGWGFPGRVAAGLERCRHAVPCTSGRRAASLLWPPLRPHLRRLLAPKIRPSIPFLLSALHLSNHRKPVDTDPPLCLLPPSPRRRPPTRCPSPRRRCARRLGSA